MHSYITRQQRGGLLTVNGLTDMDRWTLEVDSGAGKEVKPTKRNIITYTIQHHLAVLFSISNKHIRSSPHTARLVKGGNKQDMATINTEVNEKCTCREPLFLTVQGHCFSICG